MKSSDILSQLSRFETTLSDFSFNELSFEEASKLQETFHAFKKDLQTKIEGKTAGAISESKDGKAMPDRLSKETSLIANVSHEIRTPLNGIIGFTDLLKDGELTEDQLFQVSAIQSASSSLLEIVNELLEYSKLVAGREQFQKQNFNLFGLVRDVMYLCNSLIINKNVSLSSNIGQGISEELIGDPSKLTQVLLNLVGNAIKFVEEGEVDLNISILSQTEDLSLLQFQISDNGIGVAKEKIAGIFEPFAQADSNTQNKYGGTGLGLSIVKQIVKQLGGQISMVSAVNMGTTITFTMPFQIPDNNSEGKRIVPNNDNTTSSKLVRGLKVLVFEDNPLNQRLIEKRLSSWDCEIHITDDHATGIEILNNHGIDVILMDLRMPKMTGFEITELIRNSRSRRISQIPIIALTADYTIQDKEKCNAFGINDYLLKPFSPEELLTKLVKSQDNTDFSENLGKDSSEKEMTISKYRLINLDQLVSHCMNDMNMLVELVGLFKQNIDEFKTKAVQCIENEDVEGLKFSCHKIKAGLGMLEAKELMAIVKEMRGACDSGSDWKHMEYLFVSFSKKYVEVESAIDEALSRLTN